MHSANSVLLCFMGIHTSWLVHVRILSISVPRHGWETVSLSMVTSINPETTNIPKTVPQDVGHEDVLNGVLCSLFVLPRDARRSSQPWLKPTSSSCGCKGNLHRWTGSGLNTLVLTLVCICTYILGREGGRGCSEMIDCAPKFASLFCWIRHKPSSRYTLIWSRTQPAVSFRKLPAAARYGSTVKIAEVLLMTMSAFVETRLSRSSDCTHSGTLRGTCW